MREISVGLPDGRTLTVPKGASVLEVAEGIGKGLARAALAGRVDGRLVDLRTVADREELPRVAQYLAARQSPRYVRSALLEALREELLRYYGPSLPPELHNRKPWNADQKIQALQTAAAAYWKNASDSPYRRLARLHLPLYINATTGDLLADALRAEGAKPQMRLCPWNSKLVKEIPPEKYLFESDPDPEYPLVYHLYGHLSEPSSLVVTEDDYFDYLIGMTRNKDLIPPFVLSALSSTALLFLGFRMDTGPSASCFASSCNRVAAFFYKITAMPLCRSTGFRCQPVSAKMAPA